MLKKRLWRALALGLGMSLAVAAQATTLKVSSPTNHDVSLQWMQNFKAEVEERSNGDIRVELYPANQLGQLPATIEGVMFGTIEVTAPGSGFLVRVDPRFEVFDVPGLFDDLEHAQRVLADPAVLDHISEYGASSGVTPIAAFPHGPLGLLTVNGVRTLDDIRGQRIRVAGPTPLHVAPYRELGAAPNSMPLGEVLPAMQTRAIDGLLTAVPVFTTAKFYDVAKPMTVLPQSYFIVTIVASNAFLDRLPADQATMVREAARNALTDANTWNQEAVNKAFSVWEANGGEVIEFSEADQQAYLDNIERVMPAVFRANAALQGELDFLRDAAFRHRQPGTRPSGSVAGQPHS